MNERRPVLCGGLALLALAAVGCEQLPEELFFVNDTPGKVEVIIYEALDGDNNRGTAVPGGTFRWTHRPISLHGDHLFEDFDDEEQFSHIMRAGVIVVDDKGRRVRLDVKTLRAKMAYETPRRFTMHIKPQLFDAAP